MWEVTRDEHGKHLRSSDMMHIFSVRFPAVTHLRSSKYSIIAGALWLDHFISLIVPSHISSPAKDTYESDRCHGEYRSSDDKGDIRPQH